MGAVFVRNPAIAWVIAAFVTLFGATALLNLPIEQYPQVSPPALTLTYTYHGADAATMDRSATAVIDQELNGIKDLLYRSAVSRVNGTGQITLTFSSGTDLNVARTEVQDRLNRAEPRLPDELRRLGVRIQDNSSSFLIVISVVSKSGAMSTLELGDFAATKIIGELGRVPGVGNVDLFSSEKAMRIWLDPELLAGYRLSPSDVLAAVREQNSQSPGGSLAEQPLASTSGFNARITSQTRFTSPAQFREIVLRATPGGGTVRLGDVARVEIGAESYASRSRHDGKEVAGFAVQMTPGANAIATKSAVLAKLRELEANFPPDVAWSISYDSTPFIEASMWNVTATLGEAMLLVFLVMFLFLQDWRVTLIPAIVVPIALLGGCLGLWLFGLSLNQLSLFAMVVSIGILVDDAIVVVENVERLMIEEGLSPTAATLEAMRQIRGAVVGITLALTAVFIPMAFFPGSVGGIYRQFSVTLAVSIVFSALLALTLTPALCATLLRSPARIDRIGTASGTRSIVIGTVCRFNAAFDKASELYLRWVRAILARPVRWLIVAALLFAVAAVLFIRLPGGFLPDEDQGSFVINYDGQPGATIEKTVAAVAAMEEAFHALPQAETIFTVVGFNFFSQGQSAAMSWATLKPYEQRRGQGDTLAAAIAAIFAAADAIPGTSIFAVNLPAMSSLGDATGFTMKLEDRSGNAPELLKATSDAILAQAATNPKLAYVRPEGQVTAPQLAVDIDRIQARALGLAIRDVDAALAITFGSVYANDFINNGNISRVYIAADAAQRMAPGDVLKLHVRSDKGEMVPFSVFSQVHWAAGPTQLERYNGYPALSISGQAATGYASGVALAEMEKIARSALKPDQSFEWTGTAFEEKQAGGQIGLLLCLSVVIVYLVLVLLYGSWIVPLSALLVIPFGILGAVLLTELRGLPGDVYFNIGLVTIIGLAAKNAILIIEFAHNDSMPGRVLAERVLEAARRRLRPILMTSLAFVLGMVPLVFATGAGSASRHAVGTGVMGGMIAATVCSIFFTPLFYFTIRGWLRPEAPVPASAEGFGGATEEMPVS